MVDPKKRVFETFFNFLLIFDSFVLRLVVAET